MLNAFRFNPIKYSKNTSIFSLYLFATAEAKKIFASLHQQLNKKRISSIENHNNFVYFLNQDINAKQNRFGEYREIKKLLEAYLQEMGDSNNINVYNPKIINEQGARLSQIMQLITNYPKFQLQKQHLRYAYQIFCRQIHHRSNQQMSKALMFILKVDQRAQESVIYSQFLKYYLGEKWQTIKAKYQLNLKTQSIGKFMSILFSSVTHRGFLRRTPNYDKCIELMYPIEILNGLLSNPSTSESLLIRKVIYSKIFILIVQKYQKQMSSNIYHEKNVDLWEELNKSCSIVFSSNKLIQKQCIYLRQLYITLFLVLRQQNRIQILLKNLQQQAYVYGYVKQNYEESNRGKQFMESFSQLVKKQIATNDENVNKVIEHIRLDKFIFSLFEHAPQIKSSVMSKIVKEMSPITFSTYFCSFMEIIQEWSGEFLNKIANNPQGEDNYFNYLSPDQCLLILNKAVQKEIKAINTAEIYNRILQSIIGRDYKAEPTISQLIPILNIYSLHKELQLETKHLPNLQILRVFLFRFISDNKNKAITKELQAILQIIIKLNDDRTFDDEQGNYSLNIYDEMVEITENSFVDEEIKYKFREKSKKKTQQEDNRSGQIRNLLKKLAK